MVNATQVTFRETVRVRRAGFLEAAGMAAASPQRTSGSTPRGSTMPCPGALSSDPPAQGGRAGASRGARARGLRRRGAGPGLDVGDEVSAGQRAWAAGLPGTGGRRRHQASGTGRGRRPVCPLPGQGSQARGGAKRDCVRALGLRSLGSGRWALDVRVGR